MKSYKYADMFLDHVNGQWEATDQFGNIVTVASGMKPIMAELKRMKLAKEGPWAK